MSEYRVVWGGLMTCGVVLLVGIAAVVVALFLTCGNSGGVSGH